VRSYLLVTGILFALLVVAHIARMIVESAALATDPGYLAITLVAALLSVWGLSLYRRSR
jgi:hypothetical protein